MLLPTIILGLAGAVVQGSQFRSISAKIVHQSVDLLTVDASYRLSTDLSLVDVHDIQVVFHGVAGSHCQVLGDKL